MTLIPRLLLLLPGLLFAYSGVAYAGIVSVLNPGFEDITGETTTSGVFTFGPLNGWDLYDPSGITGGGTGNTFFVGTLTPNASSTNFPGGIPEGQRVGLAFNRQGSGGSGEYGLQQTLATTLQPNTRYVLDVEIGNITSQVLNLDGFPGYRVDLLAGSTVVAQDNSSLTGSIAEGTFETSSLSFVTNNSHAQIGQTLQIRLVNLNQIDVAFPTADLEVNFDNVRLNTTAVPEPSSLALFLCSSIFAAGQRTVGQRRRRSHPLGRV